MDTENYTCKLPIVGSGCVSILNSQWSNNSATLLLLHDNEAWCGLFQVGEDGSLSELLDQLSLTLEQYIQESKVALTTNGGAPNYAYSIETEQFVWKKYVRKNMAVKLGSVTISKLPVFAVFEQMIDNILQSKRDNSVKFESTVEQKCKLEKENLQLKTQLDYLTDAKNEMENTLYSQFLSLLNEKKKKLVELKKKLDPTDVKEQDPDSSLSNSAHFDSDTEIDSESEENPSSCTAKAKDSPELENDSLFFIPKRSGQPSPNKIIAGPSGCRNRDENSKSSNSHDIPTSPKKLTRVKKEKKNKPEKISCVMGTLTKVDDKISSVEDTFRFAKRPKRINSSKKTVNNLNYESDDEACLDKNREVESDSTPSQIIFVDRDESKVIKEEEDGENRQQKKDKCNNSGKTNLCSTSKLCVKIDASKSDCTRQEFSSSTLDMLNQLI